MYNSQPSIILLAQQCFFAQPNPSHPSDVTKVVNNKPALEKFENLIRIEDNKQSLKIITFNCKNCLTCRPFFNEAIQYMDVCFNSGALGFQLLN